MDLGEMETLKAAIDRVMKRKELARELGISYSSLNGYLNSFSAMPPEIREDIDRILKLHEVKEAG